MKIKDFVFDRVDGGEYYDHWFHVVGETRKELTDKYMEQSMVTVTDVVFSPRDGQFGIRRQFPFNYDVISPDDKELYETLKRVVSEHYQNTNLNKKPDFTDHTGNALDFPN